MGDLPATISAMRLLGKPVSFARLSTLKPKGFRNSSTSISPGETGSKAGMAALLNGSRRCHTFYCAPFGHAAPEEQGLCVLAFKTLDRHDRAACRCRAG